MNTRLLWLIDVPGLETRSAVVVQNLLPMLSRMDGYKNCCVAVKAPGCCASSQMSSYDAIIGDENAYMSLGRLIRRFQPDFVITFDSLLTFTLLSGTFQGKGFCWVTYCTTRTTLYSTQNYLLMDRPDVVVTVSAQQADGMPRRGLVPVIPLGEENGCRSDNPGNGVERLWSHEATLQENTGWEHCAEAWHLLLSSLRSYGPSVISGGRPKMVSIDDVNVRRASIVIPVHNNLRWTAPLLGSLSAAFESNKGPEVIVIDNGSTDGTQHFLMHHASCRTIRNPTNLGFSRACNQGMRETSREFVVFLNNDVILGHRWLEPLLLQFEDAGVGIVGAAGAVSNHECTGIGETRNPYTRFDYIPGWCMAIRREVIEKIGGFDERFGFGYFEDADFCLRAKKAGYRLRIAPHVEIQHAGAQTTESQRDFNPIDLMRKNRRFFYRKWRRPRILVARLDARGDILQTTAAVHQLRRKYMYGTITFLTLEGLMEILRDNPDIDRVIALHSPEFEQMVQNETFEIAINFQDYAACAQMLAGIDARKRLGPYLDERGHLIRTGASRYLSQDVEVIKEYSREARREKLSRPFLYARVAEVALHRAKPVLMLTDSDRHWARRFAKEWGMDLHWPLLGFHAQSAGWHSRFLPPDKIVDLFQGLLHAFPNAMILAFGTRAEQCFLHPVWPRFNGDQRVVSLLGRTHFHQMAALVQKCNIVICTDSLVRHVAVAMGTPTIAMFGATDASVAGNYGKKHIDVVSHVPCAPCWQATCENNRQCFEHLDVKGIVSTAQGLLRKWGYQRPEVPAEPRKKNRNERTLETRRRVSRNVPD